jgi:outer membrane receptor protein involved in Fe transport
MRNEMLRHLRGGLGVSLVALGLAGCGSNSEPEAPGPTGNTPQPVSPEAMASGGTAGGVAPGRQVATEDNRRNSNFITREQIEQSGARNGLEAVRYNAHFLVINQGVDLRENQVSAQHRGPDSISADDQLILVVDGVILKDLARLEDIPASMIESIEVLKASRAVLIYGLDAGGGAILIRTTR